MPSILDRTVASCRLTDVPVLCALERIIPHHLVQEAVAPWTPATSRSRLLPRDLTLLLVIAMNLYTHDALDLVLAKLLYAVGARWGEKGIEPASKGAISQARTRLGIQPVAALFHQVCTPLATFATPGAFRWGLRLMALDSTDENVADTPENERAFGRHRSPHGSAAFPQIRVTYLMECGTHAFIDVMMGRCQSGGYAAARRLLRSVTPGMLLLVDSGLCYTDLVHRVLGKGAHVLGRITDTYTLVPIAGLPDGSYLVRLYTAPPSRRRTTDAFVVVRVLVYTLTDPDRGGWGQVHRLLTSLLDPTQYPARDLICTYHERWEIELAIDELDTHQRPAQRPLRSKTPMGVVQEVYGLLLAHYAVRAVMVAAAAQAGMDPDRLSFTRALGLLITLIPLGPLADDQTRERLYQHLLDDLVRTPLPPRALRSNPRVVKRKTSKFRFRPPGARSSSLRLPFVHAIQVLTIGAAFPHPSPLSMEQPAA
jgi:hypothetical protein